MLSRSTAVAAAVVASTQLPFPPPFTCSTFNESNIYYLIEYGPIKEKTIYVLDPKTGAIKSGWGSDMFYMPHGMTIDAHGNYWITDVAMHQAFKVSSIR